jgi:hypothetical protein
VKRALLLLPLILLASCSCRHQGSVPRWEYQGQLHDAVAQCTAIVVRDDGFRSPRPTDEQGVLFTVDSPAEIRQLVEHIQFQPRQETRSCVCVGYPGMDWYRGQERVAETSVQHGRAIRWRDHFPTDAQLTEESAAWLREWLMRHGIPEKAIDFRPAPR